MKGGANASPFTVLSFLDSEEILVTRESFPAAGWPTSQMFRLNLFDNACENIPYHWTFKRKEAIDPAAG